MINKIALKNVKGVTRELELSGRDIVIAPNFSGKSAILDGLKLAHLGYLPGEKPVKTNTGIFRLSSGTEMSALCTSGDETYGTTLKLEKRSVKGESTLPTFSDDAMECMLDPSSYFNASGPAKILMMCAMIGDSDSWSAEQIIEKCLNGVEGQFVAGIRSEIEIAAKESGDNIPGVIDAIETCLKKRKADCDAAVKRMTQTVKGLTDLATLGNELENLPGKPSLAKRRDEISEKIDDLNRRIGEAGKTAEQIRSAAGKLPGLKEKLGVDYDAEIGKLKKSIETETNVLASTEKKIAEYMEKRGSLESDKKELEDMYSLLHSESESLEVEAAEMLSPEKSWIEISKKFPPEGTEAEFRVAGTWKDGTVEIARVLKWFSKDVDPKSKEKSEAKRAKATETRERMEETSIRISRIDEEIEGLDSGPLKEGREVVTQLKNAISDWKAKISGLEAGREGSSSLAEQIKELEELASMEMPSVENLEAERAVLQDERKDVDGTIQKIGNIEQDQRRCEEANAQTEQLETESKAVAGMVKQIKAVRDDIVSGSVEKGLATANRFTDGVMRAPLEYRNADIGMMIGGVFAPYETFSGSEKSLTKMAIGIALAEKSRLKMAVLDEISVFDDKNKLMMLLNLDGLVKDGVIDQFLVADCREITGLEEGDFSEAPTIHKL